MVLMLFLGFTLFPGNAHWYELDTRGIVWTVSECHVAKDGVCLAPEQEHEGYDILADAEIAAYAASHIIQQEEN